MRLYCIEYINIIVNKCDSNGKIEYWYDGSIQTVKLAQHSGKTWNIQYSSISRNPWIFGFTILKVEKNQKFIDIPSFVWFWEKYHVNSVNFIIIFMDEFLNIKA